MFIHSPSYTNGFIVIFIHVYTHHCLYKDKDKDLFIGPQEFVVGYALHIYNYYCLYTLDLSSRCVYKINAVVLNIYSSYYNHNWLYAYMYLYIYKHECLCYTPDSRITFGFKEGIQKLLLGGMVFRGQVEV